MRTRSATRRDRVGEQNERCEPHLPLPQRQQDAATTAAAAAAAACAPLSLAELHQMMAASGSYSPGGLAGMQQVLQTQAELLHGSGVDAAAVPAAQLCRQWQGFAQHLRQRMTAGSPPLDPTVAAKMLHVLRHVPAFLVQHGEMGAQEQDQLKAAIKHACRQLLSEVDNAAAAAAQGISPAAAAGLASAHVAAAAGAAGGGSAGAPVVNAAAVGTTAGTPVLPQAGPTTAAANSLSLKQLQQRLQAAQDSAKQTLDLTRPLRLISQLLYGSSYDPAIVPVAQLLQQWLLLEQHLHQRLAGPIGRRPQLATVCKLFYNLAAVSRHLAQHGDISAAELQQLAAAYGRACQRLRGQECPEPDQDEQEVPPAAENLQEHVVDPAAAEAAAGRDAAAPTQVPQVTQHAGQAPQTAEAGDAESSFSLTQLQGVLRSADFPKRSVSNFHTCLHLQAELLYGPSCDPAAVPAVGLFKRHQVLEQHLQQRLAGPVGGRPQLKTSTGQRMVSDLGSMLPVLVQQGVLSAGAQRQLDAAYKRVRMRLAGKECPELNTAPLLAAAPATEGLFSLKQLEQIVRESGRAVTYVQATVGQLHLLAELLFGPGYNAAQVPAVELFRHWQVYEQHLQQRLLGPVAGRPQLKFNSATRNLQALTAILPYLVQQGVMTTKEEQQLRAESLRVQHRLAGEGCPEPSSAAPTATAAAGPAATAAATGLQAADSDGGRTPASTAPAVSTASDAVTHSTGLAEQQQQALGAASDATSSGVRTGAQSSEQQDTTATPAGPASATPAAAAACMYSLAQLERDLCAGGLAADAAQHIKQYLHLQADLLYGPSYDPAAVPAAELFCQWQTYEQHLQQWLSNPTGGDPELVVKAADADLHHLGSVLQHLVTQHVLTAAEARQLRADYRAARSRLAASLSKFMSRSDAVAAGPPTPTVLPQPAVPAMPQAAAHAPAPTVPPQPAVPAAPAATVAGVTPPAAPPAIAVAAPPAAPPSSTTTAPETPADAEPPPEAGYAAAMPDEMMQDATPQPTVGRGPAAGTPAAAVAPAAMLPQPAVPAAAAAAGAGVTPAAPLAAASAGLTPPAAPPAAPLEAAPPAAAAPAPAAPPAAAMLAAPPATPAAPAALQAAPTAGLPAGVFRAVQDDAFTAAERWLRQLLQRVPTDARFRQQLRQALTLLGRLPTNDSKLKRFWVDYEWLVEDAQSQDVEQQVIVSSLRTLVNNVLND